MKISKIALALVLLLLPAASFADEKKVLSEEEQSRYPVSTKAGVVNHIAGNATWTRDSSADPLAAGKELAAGDVLKTQRGSFAEVLLNPGSFARLSENTDFSFHSKDTGSLKIAITKGSALIEASVVIGRITVVTPASEYAITRAGLYRFTVEDNDRTEVVVRRGRVESSGKKADSGKKILSSSGAPVITSLKNKSEDLFDLWSRQRSASLVAMANSLPREVVIKGIASSQIPAIWVYSPGESIFLFATNARFCVASPHGLPYGAYGGGALEALKNIKEQERIEQRIERLNQRADTIQQRVNNL